MTDWVFVCVTFTDSPVCFDAILVSVKYQYKHGLLRFHHMATEQNYWFWPFDNSKWTCTSLLWSFLCMPYFGRNSLACYLCCIYFMLNSVSNINLNFDWLWCAACVIIVHEFYLIFLIINLTYYFFYVWHVGVMVMMSALRMVVGLTVA